MTAPTLLSAAPNGRHIWKFYRAGGFDQVRLETGADLMALDQLDQKLWAVLSCPTRGLEFDSKTLDLIDTNKDGRIRVPEIIAAVQWACGMVKNADDLTRSSVSLPLSAINDQTPEGKRLLASAQHILASLGKSDVKAITVEDTTDTAKIFSQTRFNGDGIIPAASAEDEAVKAVVNDIIACVGGETDRSGVPGVSEVKLEKFFGEAKAYSDWWQTAESDAAMILPLGDATGAAGAAFKAVKAKVDDYFTRCRVAAFDARSAGPMNRAESDYLVLAAQELSATGQELAGFPLAKVGANQPLCLTEGINPAWVARMAEFRAQAVCPFLGEKAALTAEEWVSLCARFAPYEGWRAAKVGGAVEPLGLAKVREILAGNYKDAITALITRDRALEPEFNAIALVDKLVRFHRDLFTLLNNFVSLHDFYTRKAKAVFQAGTLYLDSRSCDLCVRVEDMAKHGALATLSRTYLAYCDCARKGSTEKMTVAAAFTGGDSDYLMVGRNGVLYDRQGQDWDATIVKVVEHPISIRQAFWAPYKRISKMISEQVEKMAASRDKEIQDRAAASILEAGKKLEPAKMTAQQAFDVGKFAGIFAAIGLAVGAIGTAVASMATGFLRLVWWQMPLALAGVILAVSGPSMIIAWLKLRQRNLGPILDANGWAVNARASINIAFGSSLTATATLPDGAQRSLEDPFADKKRPWGLYLALLAIVVVVAVLWSQGYLADWFGSGRTANPPVTTNAVPAEALRTNAPGK